MTLPPIPEGRDWSAETWRAGLDEAVRRVNFHDTHTWDKFVPRQNGPAQVATIAHATTLLDAGIVKPVVSEAESVWEAAKAAEWSFSISIPEGGRQIGTGNQVYADAAAIAVIQAALIKARAGE